jgi:hypothetical protein
MNTEFTNSVHQEFVLIDISKEAEHLTVSINSTGERLVVEGNDNLFDQNSLERLDAILNQYEPDKFIINVNRIEMGKVLAKKFQKFGRVVLITEEVESDEELNDNIIQIRQSYSAMPEAYKTLPVLNESEVKATSYQDQVREWELETGAIRPDTNESDFF